jgi:TfoX/Sxy family transcriptional regulator of competence genes
MAYDEATVERVRRALSARSDVVEKRMVGGLSFLVDGAMCCGVSGDALMVRVGRDAREATLAEPHVRPMVLGGRSLSGFVLVDPAGFRTEAELAAWVKRGVDFASSLDQEAVGRVSNTDS